MSETGALFEHEADALRDDLRALLTVAADSDVFAKKAATAITENIDQYAPILARLAALANREPELPGFDATVYLQPFHKFSPEDMVRMQHYGRIGGVSREYGA